MKNQITITIQGNAAAGKTTIATIIAKALAENGVNHCLIDDESKLVENIESRIASIVGLNVQIQTERTNNG
jgi:adenylylsulfate kinase-like enzyme